MKIRNKSILVMATCMSISALFSCVDDVKFGDAFLEKAPGGSVTKDTVYPLAELNKRIFKSANRFVVNVVYILKDCKCTYFP